MKFSLSLRLSASLIFCLLFSNFSHAQTTYTWIGGNGSWATAANWSPTRTVLAATDILQFNDGGTYTVSALPATQTIRQLFITNGSNITLQGAAASTITITGLASTTNFVISSGSTLSNTATNTVSLTISSNTQISDISGALNWNAGVFNFQAAGANVATVSSTGIVNHYGGTFTSALLRLVFDNGSNYFNKGTTTIPVLPTATWEINSTVNFLDVTTAAAITGISGQSFGHFLYNCPSQTAAAVSFQISGTTTRFKGNFSLLNSGGLTRSINFKNGTGATTINVDGNMIIADGTLNANIGATAALTLNLNGNHNQSGGTFVLTTAAIACNLNLIGDLNLSGGNFDISTQNVAGTINFDGNYNQTGGTFQRSNTGTTVPLVNFRGAGKTFFYDALNATMDNSRINYQINFANASLTLLSDFTVPTTRTFTISIGTLFCQDKFVLGAGSFTLTSVATAVLGIGSLDGIQTSGALGNIQTTTRAFGLAANYIYNGTNGQITGNGLPATTLTGFVLIDLQNNAHQITFTNTNFNANGFNLRIRSGSLANAITYTAATTSTLTYEGIATQTTTNNEFPAVSGPRRLTINNPNGVTLHAARDIPTNGVFTLTDGILSTTNTNILSVLNTAAATAIIGGSSTSFVNGPLIRAVNAAGAYPFPVGEGSVYGKIIATSQNTAAVNLRASYKDISAGGTVGTNLTSLNNYYWSLERTAGTVDLTVLVTLTKPGLPAATKVGFSTTLTGAYTNVGGLINVDEISSQLTNTISTANPNAFYSLGSPVSLAGTINSYLNLTEIANALYVNIVVGNTIFQLPTSYTGEPAYPVTFTEFVTDGPLHTVMIRPISGSTNFLTAGDPGTSNTLIDLNGTDRLTFDGRANSVGAIQWIFRNTRAASTYGPTFRFINGATNNTLTYLNIESQAALASIGTVTFSTSTALLGGNNNNTISFCNIRENTANSAVPANGVYSLGTAGAVNSGNQILNNNISNFYLGTSSGSNGIFLSTNTSDWTIDGNSFYQTVSRLNNAAFTNCAVNINNTGINFLVKNNFIGGASANCGGTAYSFTGTGAGTFNGIYFNANAAATGCEIQNNLITNINWNRGTSTSAVSFIGIRNANGNTLIKGNTIGSTSINDAIVINENFVTTPSTSNGIYQDAGTTTIEDNFIGGINAAAPLTTIAHNLYGIFISGGNSTIQNNIIGSNTVSNSLHCSVISTHATGQFLVGIQITSTATPINLLNNTIAGLTNASTSAGASTILRGIVASSSGTGIVNSIGNTIFNLRNNSSFVGTGATANTVGILHLRTAAGQSISQNTIYDLVNAHPTAVVSVTGIHATLPTSGTNVVSRNFVHSLNINSSNNTGNIIGINAFAGIATYHNNIIRLGIDATGSAISTGYNIAGIQQSSATANNLFYFNSIYIGGTGVNGNNNTYAYQRLAGTAATNLRNNIFFNERAHSSGTALNYCIGLTASTAVTSNYNVYKSDGSNGRVGLINTTTYALLTDWQNVFSNDLNSIYGPVSFYNATGNSAAVNLHIDPLVPSQNESAGIYIANYGDMDGDIRFGEPAYAGTGTAPDVGADEGEFLSADLTAPTIVYTPIPTQTVLSGPSLSATITDASGVNSTAGTKPRLYFKYSSNSNTYNNNTNATDGWKYVESVSIASPYSFTIDYNLLFGGVPTGGETMQYFVVAQDLAFVPNVAINSGAFNANPASVALTAGAFTLTGSINSYLINVLNGVVTVGTGGDYLSLTNNGGLFEAINAGSLSANLTASIISDLSAETGTHALNQWTEIGVGNYTLTLQPNNNTTRTISGTFNGALYRFNGADRVIVDGRDPANLLAGGKHLIFVNTSATTAASTWQLINEATSNTFQYTILRGSTTSATQGVFVFSTATAGTLGNSNNSINNCDIHQHAAALPVNGIYSAGTAGRVNSNNIIDNNNIFNFFSAAGGSSGILLAANTSDWTIEDNKFYQEAARTTTSASTFHYVININNTANTNTIIRGNYIGGSAADGSGTMNYTAAVANQFAPIYLNTNSTVATPTIIENNTITNIAFTTISAATSGIGPFTAIYQLAGASRMKGNIIGSSTLNNAIVVTVNTNSNGVVNAIRYDGTSTAKIENNTIGGITVNGTGTNNGTNFYAINIATGNVAVKNNFIGSPSTTHSIQVNGTATSNASVLGAINIVATAAYSDSLLTNSIYNLTNFNGGTGSRILGINATSGAQYIIVSNTIRNLTLTNSTNIGTTSSAAVLGIALSTANTQLLSLSKNTIHSLSNTGSGGSAFTTGIYYSGGTNTSNVIEKNFIHSLSPSTGATASVVGIQLAGGTTTNVRNNMIRLGIDGNGASISQSHNIAGILQTANNIHNIYFNSIYIGGGSVSGSLSTFAYQRNQASHTTATTLRNNIFTNSRSNAAGTGLHYTIGLNTSTAFITSNYNLFYANGNGGAVGLEVATTHTNLTSWQGATGFDINSLYGVAGFINESGNAAVVDLHINPLNPTQVESTGLAVGIFDDVDNDIRFGGGGYAGTGTAVDIGADEGDFIPQDLTPPFIVYTPIPTQTVLTPPNLIATVTDASGVAASLGTAPRIYFKRSTDANTYINNTNATNGWKYVESTTGSSPFNLSIDYNLLFGAGVVGGETIQYFVIAQDMALPPNVGINTGDFNTYPFTVALASGQFPMTNFINSYIINVLSGVVTVGSGGNYPSLTNNGGLFQAINSGSLSGNLIAEVISNLTLESGTHALNQWTEVGVGNYTLTIRPNNNTQRIISGSYVGASAALAGLFRFDGADRVIIDGRDPSNLPGNGRHLLFRNESVTSSNFNSTFNYINDAKNHSINYSIVEGASASSSNGVILISTASATGSGNDNIVIDQCRIRDLSSIAGTPANGIYALGTASRENNSLTFTNNEIYNFWQAGVACNGIFISTNNTEITITGNSFYQSVSRTGTGAITRSGIQINNSTANNIIIENNYIGGTTASAGGSAMTITGNINQSFVGIWHNVAAASGVISIQNNTIKNIDLSHGTTANTSIFTGILHTSGNASISGNTIGSNTGNGSITVNSNLAGLNSIIGISATAGSNTIDNNAIGSISLIGSGVTVGMGFTGINLAGSGTFTVNSNTIGSTITTNSINSTAAVTSSYAVKMLGINQTATGNVTLDNNTISNINSNYAGVNTGAQVIGITTSTGSTGLNTITNNQINNLSASSANPGTILTASVIGILNQRTTVTAPGQVVSSNIIHSLSNANASAAVQVIGLVHNGGTTGTHVISKNFIHSFNISSSNATSSIIGILNNAGLATYHNNMIRLGIDQAGNPISTGYNIIGIQHSTATAANTYYFNSISIGGTAVLGANSTYAFYRSTGTASVTVRNNIFRNARSNGAGTGLHYAIGLPTSITGVVSNNNLFYAGGVGGNVGLQVASTRNTLTDWQTNTTQDAASFYENVVFVNPNGNATTVNLHVNNVSPTQVESGGFNVGIFEDIDSDIRFGGGGYAGTGTAVDIGADEDNFGVLDVTPPVITYTPIPNQLVLTGPLLSANIIDNTGVEVTTGIAPRIYFKRTTDANTYVDNTNASNGWKYVESITGLSPFDFTIDYSILFGGSVIGGETIEYFVVAQDVIIPANVGQNNVVFTSNPNSVNLSAANFPASGSINSYLINLFSGVITVGTNPGDDFPSLTNNGGLFEAINNAALSGNVIAEITTDLIIESGTHALNQWNEVGVGNYTLTMRPNNNITKVISGTYAGTTIINAGLYRLNGADRVTIDGRDPSNISAGGKHLLFRNLNTANSVFNSTFNLVNDAQNNNFQYSIIEGASTNGTNGVFRISTALGGGVGNDNILIDHCNLRDLSNTTGLPVNGIYALGSTGFENNNVTISNNEIFNFWNATTSGNGIFVSTGNTAWNISGNSLYQTNTQTGTGAILRYGIQVINTSGNNFNISGNYIGGTQANAGGTPWTVNGSVNQSFIGILLSQNTTLNDGIVNNNTIANFNWNHGTTANTIVFAGIQTIGSPNNISNNNINNINVNEVLTSGANEIYGIHVLSGNAQVTGNSIGNLAGTSVGGAISVNGISQIGAGTVTIANNIISNINSAYTGTLTTVLNRGINAISGVNTITGNTIYSNSSAATAIGTGLNASIVGLAQTSATTGQMVRSNTIYGIENQSASANTQVIGILYRGTIGTNEISRNFIHSLKNTSTGSSASITGILSLAGVSTYHNNMIRLGIDAAGASISNGVLIYGIDQQSPTAGNQFLFNTIHIGGTGVTGANNSFAFNRTVGTVALNLRNNILSNNRSNGAGTGLHYAIGTNSLTAFSSNYNLFDAGGVGGNVGLSVATTCNSLAAWNVASSQDANSYFGAPGFINETGNAAAVNLHINPLNPTQVESTGTPVGVTIDIDNDFRFGDGSYSGTGTAPDIGADEGEFIYLDIIPPVIVYTPIPNQTSLVAPNLQATITDNIAVNVITGTKPRLYFKRFTDNNTYVDNTNATNGWKYVESTSIANPFDFAIDYNLLFGTPPTGITTIQYFVVAQDLAPNVAVNQALFNSSASSVALHAANFPVSGSINSYNILVFSGIVTVGTNPGDIFPSLTNNGGAFEAINGAVLVGNLTLEITSDLLVESGTHPLNQWMESGVGNYTLTIRPNGSTPRVITGSYSGANAAVAGLYRFNGADRVIIDGRDPGNLGAGDRNLLFRNSNNAANNFNGTFTLINDAKDYQIKYAVIEGATTGTLNGALRISTSSATGSGNDNILIDNCYIRDLSSGVGAPSHGIYALGTASRTNDNITISNNQIFNYHLPGTVQHAAIYIGGNTENCNINNNSIYQSTIHTTASFKYGIIIDNMAAGNFTISNNFIGGNSAGANGTWQVNASGLDYRFTAISMSTAISPSSLVENNIIRNFNITTGTAFQTQGSTFTGIYGSNGEYNIQNNVIGSLTQNGNITIICSAGQFTNVHGIYHSGNAAINVLNNQIGGIALSNASSSANIVNLYGVRVGSTTISQNITVNSNTIGSIDAPITNATGNTYTLGTSIFTGGIYIGNARPTTVNDNNVHHIYYTANGTSTTAFQVAGIFRTTGAATNNLIQNNVVTNIRSNSAFEGVANNIGLTGIYFASTANGHTISGNTIYDIQNTRTTSGIAVQVAGLYYSSGSSSATNFISSNFIHSLTTATTSATATITGLWLNAGASTISNNMIRLGIIGASSQINGVINGINEAAGLNMIYFNSVYLGGSGANNSANSHNFLSAVVSGTRQIQNNIFYNARSNAGTGKNYAIKIGATTGLVSDYNLLHVSGTNGVLGFSGTDQVSLFVWKTSTGLDVNSIASNPLFIDPNGDETNVDLHIQAPPALTPIEAIGTPIAGLDIDFDGEIRSTYTPTDIGADAGNYLNLDVSAPLISYTPIPTQATCGPTTNIDLMVTITDMQSGISLGSNFPRLYIRRSIGGAPGNTWGSLAQIVGTYQSGTSNSSVWKFTIDYTALGITPLPGNEFEYYIVAQDLASPFNIGYSQSNAFSPVHSNVSTPVIFPNFAFPANGMFSFSNPLSGTVTVGTAGDYPNFNNATNGLFKAIMDRGIASDLEVLVISNVDEAADYYPLGVVQEFCGSNYTITIKPNAASPYVIQSNISGANSLINFIGTKRVVVDGSFGGTGKYLTFRQRSTAVCSGTSNPTFYFSGTAVSAASEIEIKNCIIEGNNRLTACIGGGVLNFGNLLSTGLGMNNIMIDSNVIRNRSDIAQTAINTPWNLIQIGDPNSTNIPRSNIQITNNEMFNFSESAIQIRQNNSGQGIGNGFVISGNKIYEPINTQTYQYPIWLEGGTSSHSHVISNNLIGGNASPSPNITGTWLNSKADGEMQAIYVLVGGSNAGESTSIQGNKIKNINISGTGWTNFVGIRVEEGRVNIGDIVGNVIGSEDNTPDNIISNGSGGSFLTEDAAVMGIWTQSSSETIIENNLISGLSTGFGTFCFLDGIAHGSNLYFNSILYNNQGGTASIRNNQIKNNRSSSNLQNSSVSNEGMISLFVYTNSMSNVIEGNVIENNGCNAISARNVRIHGVMLGVFGQIGNHGGVFRKNTIAALANGNVGEAGNVAPEINGLALNFGNWVVSNNMISLRNGTTGTHITNTNTTVVGIRDGLLNTAGQGAQYLYNSVYVYGQNGGSAPGNASYAYLRFAINYAGPALSNGAPTTLRNNILINERIGIGNHRAIGNIAVNPATGWNTTASNYNFVCNLNTAVTTRWGTTDYTWANWLVQSGGDANSNFIPAGATTIANTQLKPTDLFAANYLFGNLRVSLLNTDATNFIDNLGTPVAVIDDIDADARHATTPDRGADEFNFCQLPDVTLQPVDQLNVCANSTVNFSTTVTGLAPITLQWQESTNGGATWNNLSNTGIYSGTASNTLTLTGVTNALNNNKYRLYLTNSCGVDSSNAATLTLVQTPVITLYSPLTFVNTICSGNTSFQVTATGTSLTYQWQVSTDNGSTWNNVLNVAPYSGAITNQLAISNIPPPNLDGNKYQVIITDACSTSITSNVGTLNVGVANITVQPPASQIACDASTATIGVTATGSGTTYQWQVSTDNGGTWNNTIGPDYSNVTSNTLGINVNQAMNLNQYRVIVNSTCNVPTVSDVTLLKVRYVGQWLGAGSNWDTPGNWGCGVIPTSTVDVVIPTVPELGIVFPVVSSTSISLARNITIQIGASITVQSTSDLSLYGKLINHGTASLGAGTVKFVAAVAQQIDGSTNSQFGKLVLNNSYTLAPALELNQAISVTNELQLNNGKLNLNGFELLIGQSGTDGNISGASSASYIIADGSSSMLKRYTTQTGQNYNFPIGDLNYFTPLNLTFNSAGLSNNSVMNVKVNAVAHPGIGAPIPTSYINRYWSVEPQNVSGSLNYNINYTYNDADVVGIEATIKAYKYNAAGWIAALGTGAQFEMGTANYLPGINQIAWSGLSTFSDFTGLGNGTPLPISLLLFNAYPVLEEVEIVWTTATEINNDYFTIEKSQDGFNFTELMRVTGAGNSNQILNYKQRDVNPFNGTSYYRLKQTDFDGNYSYSEIRVVNFNQTAPYAGISVFPNPVDDHGIYIKNGLLEDNQIEITLLDVLGQVVQENKLAVNTTGDTHYIALKEDLSVGVYHLQIKNNQKITVVKLMIK